MSDAYFYTAHGTGICSDLPLPEFPLTALEGPDSIKISALAELPLPAYEGERFWINDSNFHVAWDQVGTFRVAPEGEIHYKRVSEASDELIRVPLLGSVLAVALHFRNTLVMHGNAMSVNGRGVIVVGSKGRGKSTLSAAMVRAGHAVHAEDAASVDLSEGSPVVAFRGTRQLRLWRDSFEHLLSAAGLATRSIHELSDKCVVSLPDHPEVPARLPLDRLYIVEEAKELSFQPLSPAEAWQQVLVHSLISRFGSALLVGSSGARHFAACSALAKQVPCVRLRRPREFSQLGELVARIEQDLASA